MGMTQQYCTTCMCKVQGQTGFTSDEHGTERIIIKTTGSDANKLLFIFWDFCESVFLCLRTGVPGVLSRNHSVITVIIMVYWLCARDNVVWLKDKYLASQVELVESYFNLKCLNSRRIMLLITLKRTLM